MNNAAYKMFGEDASILSDLQFQIFITANLMGVLGTALVSPLLDTLIGAFDVSPAQIGLLMSVFTAPPILMIPVAGALADRYGRKPIIICSLVLFGTAGVAIALTTDFLVVLALRFLQGIGFAGIVPIIVTSIGDLYTGTREATAQGLRFATSGLSMMVFPLLAGGLMVVGWQYPFLLFGFSFPIAGILYILLDEPALTSSDSGKARKKTEIQELRELIRQPRILSIVLARGLPNIVWTAFLTYNSIVVVQLLDGTPQQAGLLVSIGSAAFALSASQAGRIAAVFNSRLLPLVAANLALTLGSMLIAFGDLILVFIGATVIGLGFGITMSIYRSIITGYAPLQHRGGLVSIAESVGRVTATTTPILMGAAIAYGSERFGFTGAVRWTFFGISLFGGLAGVILVGISSRSAPVRD